MTVDQRTTRLRRGRVWPALDPLVFSAALVLYAVAVPLGLGRVDAASHVSAALALDSATHRAPLVLLATRLLQYLPAGDVGLRANLLSGLACAFAIALIARLSVELTAIFRPPPSARQNAGMFLCEPIAAAGVALAAALSLATFESGTTAGTSAPALALLLGALLAELALLRDIGNASAGLALAGLSGLSCGIAPAAGPLLWPFAAGLALWGLRRGARWPLLAPLCFVTTLGIFLLATCAASSVPLSLGEVLVSPFSVVPQGRGAVWTTAVEIADQVGAVGILLAGIGVFALFSRAALVAAWLAMTWLTCLLFANGGVSAGGLSARAALPAAIAVTCLLGSVGVVHVSSRLGRARVAAALALAVILVFSPAMDGGRGRWVIRPLAMRLLDRALNRAEVRSTVEPGSVGMAGLFSLGRAIGLRPDLEIVARP